MVIQLTLVRAGPDRQMTRSIETINIFKLRWKVLTLILIINRKNKTIKKLTTQIKWDTLIKIYRAEVLIFQRARLDYLYEGSSDVFFAGLSDAIKNDHVIKINFITVIKDMLGEQL